MQDEVTKHTKKIYTTVKNPKYSFSEKVKETSVEIFIIVFAVSLSIWLHSCSEHRHEQAEVKLFLQNVREDLKKDIESLNKDKEQYIQTNKQHLFVANITSAQIDSLEKLNQTVSFPIHAPGQKINNGNYESFKSSGKIGFIENEKLKQGLLSYYQKTVPNIIYVDNLYNTFLFKTFDIRAENADKTEKEIYLNPKLRATIGYAILLGKNNIRLYDEFGIQQANELIEEISKTLKE